MSNWLEEELSILTLYQDQTKNGDFLLPQWPAAHFYELNNELTAETIQSITAMRSGNYFSSRVQASIYGQALSVMLRLRHMVGNIAYQEGAFVIEVDYSNTEPDVYPMQVDRPVFFISGFFLEMDQAITAIDTIGVKHIHMAYKTLMCIR